MSAEQTVAAWLGISLLAAFLVAFCYYAQLGYMLLQQKLAERLNRADCTCGHRYDSHYSELRSCSVGLCTCRQYTSETLAAGRGWEASR